MCSFKARFTLIILFQWMVIVEQQTSWRLPTLTQRPQQRTHQRPPQRRHQIMVRIFELSNDSFNNEVSWRLLHNLALYVLKLSLVMIVATCADLLWKIVLTICIPSIFNKELWHHLLVRNSFWQLWGILCRGTYM